MSDWGERNEAALATSAQRRRLEAELDDLRREYNVELVARIEVERELGLARAACADVEAHRELGARRLLEAEREIDRLKAELREECRLFWIIARDNSRTCDGCKQTIRRGEAYRWIGEDGHWHVLCPDEADPPVHLLTAGDDHVHCCGRLTADVLAAEETLTLSPHAVTCRARTAEATNG